MASLTRSLQDAVVERLALLVLEGVPVHAQVRGDLESKILQAFSRRGIIVLVLPPLIEATNPNVSLPGPMADKVVVTVRIEEDLLYRSDPDVVGLESAHELVERILVSLTNWKPSLTAVLSALQPERNAVREDQQGNVVVCEVAFATKATLDATAISATLAASPISASSTELYATGTTDLVSGVSQPGVTFADAFEKTPRVIVTRVVSPVGSPVLTFQEEPGSRHRGGFYGDLSATPGAGYKLSWIAIL